MEDNGIEVVLKSQRTTAAQVISGWDPYWGRLAELMLPSALLLEQKLAVWECVKLSRGLSALLAALLLPLSLHLSVSLLIEDSVLRHNDLPVSDN